MALLVLQLLVVAELPCLPMVFVPLWLVAVPLDVLASWDLQALGIVVAVRAGAMALYRS